MNYEEIVDRFGFHKGTEKTLPLHRQIRKEFIDVTETLVELVPDGREKALMVTALEEASMWANAGVARKLAPVVKE